MMRKPPRELGHGPTVTCVGAMEGFSIWAIPLILLSKVTGPPILPGTCDRCHWRMKDAETAVGPMFPASMQILAKASVALAAGVAGGLLFGGRIATLLGLALGNLAARPLVDGIARRSGPEMAPPQNAEFLPPEAP